jgi:uncharacterized membrane protein (UPF0127 family)
MKTESGYINKIKYIIQIPENKKESLIGLSNHHKLDNSKGMFFYNVSDITMKDTTIPLLLAGLDDNYLVTDIIKAPRNSGEYKLKGRHTLELNINNKINLGDKLLMKKYTPYVPDKYSEIVKVKVPKNSGNGGYEITEGGINDGLVFDVKPNKNKKLKNLVEKNKKGGILKYHLGDKLKTYSTEYDLPEGKFKMQRYLSTKDEQDRVNSSGKYIVKKPTKKGKELENAYQARLSELSTGNKSNVNIDSDGAVTFKHNGVDYRLGKVEKPIVVVDNTVKEEDNNKRTNLVKVIEERKKEEVKTEDTKTEEKKPSFIVRNKTEKDKFTVGQGALGEGTYITTFNPFTHKSKIKEPENFRSFLNSDKETEKDAYLIGVNQKTGNLKLGQYNDFDNDYLVSQTYSPKFAEKIDWDDKEGLVYYKPKDSTKYNKKIALPEHKDYNKLMIATPDNKAYKIVTGNSDQLKAAFEAFKKEQKTDGLNLWIIDNGIYRKDPYQEKEDLDKWDARSKTGGHFIYLPKQKQGGMIYKQLQQKYYQEGGKQSKQNLYLLDDKGEHQMKLKGGERIFSRIKTKELVKLAKVANKSKSDKDYFNLGKVIANELYKQDYVNKPEYTKD